MLFYNDRIGILFRAFCCSYQIYFCDINKYFKPISFSKKCDSQSNHSYFVVWYGFQDHIPISKSGN